MIEALGQLTHKEIFLNSAILALVFRTVWALFSEVTNHVRQFLAKRVQSYDIDLGPYHSEFDGVIEFNCLIIRYGTDGYLQGLASERDKFDGRLQNKIIPISVERTEEDVAKFALKLPVHQRIGTQFKCFADVQSPEDFDAAFTAISNCDRAHGVSKSSSQFRNRIYFLLQDFSTCKSSDGIENNVCFPV